MSNKVPLLFRMLNFYIVSTVRNYGTEPVVINAHEHFLYGLSMYNNYLCTFYFVFSLFQCCLKIYPQDGRIHSTLEQRNIFFMKTNYRQKQNITVMKFGSYYVSLPPISGQYFSFKKLSQPVLHIIFLIYKYNVWKNTGYL